MDALRARLSETLRLLADLARSGRSDRSLTSAKVDSWRQRISLKVAEAQGLIESSKFEPHELDLDVVQRRTADAQVVFVLLLALARHASTSTLPRVAQVRASELDVAIATALEILATRAAGGFEGALPDLASALAALERAIHSSLEGPGHETSTLQFAGALALYRSLVASVARLFPVPLAPATAA
jgi:hypothetical protein